jgi:GNAT superfamily N-acetyltransferase
MIEYQFNGLYENDIPKLNSIKPESWTSITEIHSHYLETCNCYCIKAVSNNQIIGIGTGICFDKTGWLAHIIVASEYQNKGVGSSIINNRIEFLRDIHGCKAISLTATDQGYPVYKKIGFIEQGMYIIMERNEEINKYAGVSKKIKRINAKDYSSVYELDKKVSGENRIELLRPIIDKCFIYEENNKVLGCYLPDFGDSGVIAETEQAGIALLDVRINDPKKIFVPEENITAYKFLLEKGYKEVKRIYRMILGESFSRSPNCCYARIGGFAG